MARPRMIVVAGPPGSGKTSSFPVTAFGVDAFNIDDRCAQILGSYRAIPREVRRAAARHGRPFGVRPEFAGALFHSAQGPLRGAAFRRAVEAVELQQWALSIMPDGAPAGEYIATAKGRITCLAKRGGRVLASRRPASASRPPDARIPQLGHLQATLDSHQDAGGLMSTLFAIVAGSGHKLYLLIDEYDHFGNRSPQARFNAMAGFTRADVERAVDEFLLGKPELAQDPRLGDRSVVLQTLFREQVVARIGTKDLRQFNEKILKLICSRTSRRAACFTS